MIRLIVAVGIQAVILDRNRGTMSGAAVPLTMDYVDFLPERRSLPNWRNIWLNSTQRSRGQKNTWLNSGKRPRL